MGFKRFSLLLSIRVILIVGSLALLAFLIALPGYYAASLLVFVGVGIQVTDIWTFVKRTNAELTRFFDAARYADFSQRFELTTLGAGFEELGETFNDILAQFREKRREQEKDLSHLKALLEHVPVPLLSVFHDGKITLWNNAARRLFGSVHVTKLSDLHQFGDDLQKMVETVRPGERHLVPFETETRSYQLTLAATEVVIAGGMERLISLQDIQSELDAVQLEAWQELVRVLTHEIMNSITPVASLAKTTVDLVDDVKEQIKADDNKDNLLTELEDVGSAVETVARRSDSLMAFVTSYRRLTRLPAPRKETFLVADLLKAVTTLVASELEAGSIRLTPVIEPESLTLTADRAMVEQILINLIQNARQALEPCAGARLIKLEARLNKRGQVYLRLADNGPGIPDDIKAKVFVPFYTTKREGSGVGLALSRQIMIAHGGAVTLGDGMDNDQGGHGAAFTLTF